MNIIKVKGWFIQQLLHLSSLFSRNAEMLKNLRMFVTVLWYQSVSWMPFVACEAASAQRCAAQCTPTKLDTHLLSGFAHHYVFLSLHLLRLCRFQWSSLIIVLNSDEKLYNTFLANYLNLEKIKKLKSLRHFDKPRKKEIRKTSSLTPQALELIYLTSNIV